MSAVAALLPIENSPVLLGRAVKRRIPSPRNREVFLPGQRDGPFAGRGGQVTQGEELGLAPAELLRYAERLLEMRLDYQSQAVMEDWRKSREDKVQLKERRDKAGEILWTEKTTTTQTGKVGCLSHALRLTLAREVRLDARGVLAKLL